MQKKLISYYSKKEVAMEMQLLWRNTTAITGRTRC